MSTIQLQAPRPEDAFQDFFRSFEVDAVGSKYRKRLGHAAVNGEQSLTIDFEDLITFDPALARNVVEHPDDFVSYATSAATAQMRVEDPEYAEFVGRIHARFRGIPEKTLIRKVGSEHLNKMVRVDGIMVRTGQVRPVIVMAVFRCKKCAEVVKQEQTGDTMRGPGACPQCKQTTSYDLLEKESLFKNTQEARVQERPEDLSPGQLPRYLDVRLDDDLVDSARPGDRIALTAIVRPERQATGEKGKLRTFNVYHDANSIEIIGKETVGVEITIEDENKILEAAQDPWVDRKLIHSIAPSIYGYEDIKEAILYLLLGGVPKKLPDGVTIRGDSHSLIIGDPGTAKSQLLQYVARIAPRGLYTSGRGSSAAGLTAAVLREKTGGMVLEAGALVLADKGIACIDEIDKMLPIDRVAIHEAMEQQTVSVAKGGIVATLNARASVLAAGNPKLGRYDPFLNVGENINLDVTILSRFDLIFLLRDEANTERDARMAEHILALHKTRVTPEAAPFEPDFLRKYISYAKRLNPILTPEAMKELLDFYLKMRSKGGTKTVALAITPRQLEALVRLSEARARAFLRDHVKVEDAKSAIRLVNVSMGDVGVDVTTGTTDIDVIMTGIPRSFRDNMQKIIDVILELSRESGSAERATVLMVLKERENLQEGESLRLLGQLIKDGIIYMPQEGRLKRVSG